MTTKEFIEKYNKAKDKIKFLSERNTAKYIPFEKKMAYCENIVEKTTYKNIDGKKVYWENTPIQYLLFSLTLINVYSDIDIDFSNMLDEFNLLDEAGCVDLFVSIIPETEYAKFKTILNMVSDDNYKNLRSLTGWLDSKLDGVDLLLKEIAQTSSIEE